MTCTTIKRDSLAAVARWPRRRITKSGQRRRQLASLRPDRNPDRRIASRICPRAGSVYVLGSPALDRARLVMPRRLAGPDIQAIQALSRFPRRQQETRTVPALSSRFSTAGYVPAADGTLSDAAGPTAAHELPGRFHRCDGASCAHSAGRESFPNPYSENP